MPGHGSRLLPMVSLLTLCIAAHGQDLHIKKSVSVGGTPLSTSETSIKGARIRDVNQTPAGNTVTLRECDLKRTITINDQAQSYYVANDPQDAAAARAAALATGVPAPEATAGGGQIDVTTTIADTGERKQMFGYSARHLKLKVAQVSSQNACSPVHQNFEIDGWYADLNKEIASCPQMAPPVPQAQGCQDAIVEHHTGTGKPGYPLSQTISVPNPNGSPTTVTIAVSELTKQNLEPALFDIPAGYHQVNSLAELHGLPQNAPQPVAANSAMANSTLSRVSGNPASSVSRPMNPQMMAQFAAANGMPNSPNMLGMHNNQLASTPVAVPQALGPKAAGMIRIGVAPPDAQLGQGNNAGADYSTPIRNAIVLLMNGPAVEIAALDSHIDMQLQAEAQQKQCDFILYSAVAVKHTSSSGFGKLMKMAAPVASMTPMGAMTHGMGTAMAATAASAAAQAAAMSSQQQVMSQLAGFNGQIKSKDDVTVQYQLFQTGQSVPRLQNSLQGKAKSDGEDVLTPLLTQTATTVLTDVSKK